MHKHREDDINRTIDDITIVGSVIVRPESLISNIINNDYNDSEEFKSRNKSSSSDSD